MKIPKSKTIRGRIYAYAYKAGFTVVKEWDGTYGLFDNRAGWYVQKGVDMDTIVRLVIDELYAIKFRQETEASLK